MKKIPIKDIVVEFGGWGVEPGRQAKKKIIARLGDALTAREVHLSFEGVERINLGFARKAFCDLFLEYPEVTFYIHHANADIEAALLVVRVGEAFSIVRD